MLGNATNLTNTTSLVGVLGGFWVFLSDFWQELSALAAIITIISVVIGLIFKRCLQKKQHEHDKEMEKLRQEYDEKIRQKAKDAIRAMKLLRYFIRPFITDLERVISNIKHLLDTEQFGVINLRIKPNYEFAYTNIFGSENYGWLKGKVNEYNNVIEAIKDTKTKFEQAIEGYIGQTFSNDIELLKEDMQFLVHRITNNDTTSTNNPEGVYGFWKEHKDEFLEIKNEGEPLDRANEIKQYLNKAKSVATELKDRLEDLKGQYLQEWDIWEPEIEIDDRRIKAAEIMY
jgi:uncharacterized protein YukE